MKWSDIALTIVLIACVAPFVHGADEITITGDWTIVRPVIRQDARGVDGAIAIVAGTFADVLDEAIGKRPKVVEAGQEPQGPGGRVFIGREFAETAGLMPADFKGWDFGMAEKDGDLYLFGRDRVGSSPKDNLACVNPSSLATIRFLRDHVGALFLMPGKVGLEVPRLERLTIPKGFSRRGKVNAPFQTGRWFDLAYNFANAIYGRGVLYTYGGHTYTAACPRGKYFKTNPEYFARNKKGEAIWGGSDHCQAYCISNPDFQKLVYDDMLRRYDEGADICQLGQNDGAAGVCKCKACHDLYGTGDDWCEKIWLYHREIAERILKDRPGKLVHIMCYGDTADPPKTFKKFPPNVLIEICRHGEEDMRKWDGYTVPHGFTYYIYNWSWYPLLGFTPKRSVAGLVDQVKRFHKYGMKGIYRCGFGEMFGMEGPAYWVFNHLVEDANTDAIAALAIYYKGAFGPAAAAMKRFYEDLEAPLAEVEKLNSTKASDLVEETIMRNGKRDPVKALARIYTPERVARMDAALAEAESTEGLSPKAVRRLQLVRTEWNYVRNVGSIAYLYNDWLKQPAKEQEQRIVSLVAERNRMITQMFPNGKMRPIKGWPEIKLFGNPPIEHMKENGRLLAPIKEPLNWDVERRKTE